jgi:hypothetical protein
MASPPSSDHPARSMRSRARGGSSPIHEPCTTPKVSRRMCACLVDCSERNLAIWERGKRLRDIYESRLNELRRLYVELSGADPKILGAWVTMPHERFDGFKPREPIELGETFASGI